MQLFSRLAVAVLSRIGASVVRRRMFAVLDPFTRLIPRSVANFVRTRRRETAAIVAGLVLVLLIFSSRPEQSGDGYLIDDDLALVDELTQADRQVNPDLETDAQQHGDYLKAKATRDDEWPESGDLTRDETDRADFAVADYRSLPAPRAEIEIPPEPAAVSLPAPRTELPRFPAPAVIPGWPAESERDAGSSPRQQTYVPAAGTVTVRQAVRQREGTGARLLGIIEEFHDVGFSTTGYTHSVNTRPALPRYSQAGR